jgi:HEAT repeat protein
LGKIGGEAAVAPLLTHLDDAETNVWSAAAEALGELKSEAAVIPLLARLEDADEWVRRVAARALGKIGSEAAVTPLIARLDHSDAAERQNAFGGLAQGLEALDRKLLSRDLDGYDPFLDPHDPISEKFARKAAKELGLPLEEVRARYEALAGCFGLRLSWRKDA